MADACIFQCLLVLCLNPNGVGALDERPAGLARHVGKLKMIRLIAKQQPIDAKRAIVHRNIVKLDLVLAIAQPIVGTDADLRKRQAQLVVEHLPQPLQARIEVRGFRNLEQIRRQAESPTTSWLGNDAGPSISLVASSTRLASSASTCFLSRT